MTEKPEVKYTEAPEDLHPEFGDYISDITDILNKAADAGMSANGMMSLAMNTAVSVFIGLELNKEDVEQFAEALPMAFEAINANEAIQEAKSATIQ